MMKDNVDIHYYKSFNAQGNFNMVLPLKCDGLQERNIMQSSTQILFQRNMLQAHYQTAWHHISETCNLNIHCHESLKSYLQGCIMLCKKNKKKLILTKCVFL